MSITRGVLAQSPEPEAHDKVSPEKNLSEQGREPPTKLISTYDVKSGNRTRATLVASECSHHCAIPAPQKQQQAPTVPATSTNRSSNKHRPFQQQAPTVPATSTNRSSNEHQPFQRQAPTVPATSTNRSSNKHQPFQ